MSHLAVQTKLDNINEEHLHLRRITYSSGKPV